MDIDQAHVYPGHLLQWVLISLCEFTNSTSVHACRTYSSILPCFRTLNITVLEFKKCKFLRLFV
jgi:hypothetical protein